MSTNNGFMVFLARSENDINQLVENNLLSKKENTSVLFALALEGKPQEAACDQGGSGMPAQCHQMSITNISGLYQYNYKQVQANMHVHTFGNHNWTQQEFYTVFELHNTTYTYTYVVVVMSVLIIQCNFASWLCVTHTLYSNIISDE